MAKRSPMIYTLKIYPKGMARTIYRVVEVPGDLSLDDLCSLILELFDFTHEHLYEFCMDNKPYGKGLHYVYQPPGHGSWMMEEAPGTNIALDKIGLVKGQNFSLHYDYGDDWLFTIHVQNIATSEAPRQVRLLKEAGKLVQYPDWDEEEEEDWEDED